MNHPRYTSDGFIPAQPRMTPDGRGYAVPIGMLPDPPEAAASWVRAGYAAKHFSGQIFYRIRLKQGKI